MNEKKKKQVRVLIVEENDKFGDYIAEALAAMKSLSVRSTRAASLEEMVTLLGGVKFNAVFVDVDSKTHSEKYYLDELKAFAPNTPIILLASTSDVDFMEEVVAQYGIYDYLIKLEVNSRVIRTSLKYTLAKKEAELNCERLESELRHAQKMEILGQLSGGVAHDFNNKLAIISGNIFTAAEMLDDDNPTQNLLASAQKAVESAAQLTKQLLDFSKKREKKPEKIDLGAQVKSSVNVLNSVVGETIELGIKVSCEDAMMNVSSTQIDQVIMNLVINARDAIEGKGRIDVELNRVCLEEKRGKAPLGKELFCLSVRDTGSGMSKATLQHIFEPFYSTKDEDKGTGLGLSIVNRTVAELGGCIHVTSELGQGTCFEVYFEPSYEAENELAA